MLPTPLVSIVMPTFRRASQIGASIRTLLCNTLEDFELLVRDDGDGSDRTEEAVREAARDDPRVHYRRNSRPLGMPESLNGGILEAQGEFIAVCHDHDLYKHDFLKNMVGALQDSPKALFVHCAIELMTQSGECFGTQVGDWPEVMPGADWLRIMLRTLDCPVCALTVVRREAHRRYGIYDPRFGFVADVELWMRLARTGDVAYVSRPLISVREREPGHFAADKALEIVRIVDQIHREYLPVAYTGWRLGLEHARLRLQVARKTTRIRLGFLRRQLRVLGPKSLYHKELRTKGVD
jgi:glycosyltransferase involved in cell wall biosynthesis